MHQEYVDTYLSDEKNSIEKMTPEDLYGERITNQHYKIMYVCMIKKNIADYIRKTETLLHIDLSNNEMGDSVLDIVRSIKFNSYLLSIHLSGNRFTS